MRGPATAEDCLRRALNASAPAARERYAREGLAAPTLEEDTRFLLLRQIYRAHIEKAELELAIEVALQMAETGTLRDIALHDAARAQAAVGERAAAIDSLRLAARAAPPSRRSFQLWSLATLQHFAGADDAALETLERASRWASRDRILIDAHAAYIELDRGGVPEGLPALLAELRTRPLRGYLGYLAGMIGHHSGDQDFARIHLRAFLRRNAAADPAKVFTLFEELRRARVALAQIESD
jgi:hypothetical protein